MPLRAQERNVLFETPVLSRQIRKYVGAKGRVPVKQARLEFGDIGTKTFYATVDRLIKAGDLLRDGNDLCMSLEAKAGIGTKADACWKAARLLGTFRVAKLAKVADIRPGYATTLCTRWRKEGFLQLLDTDGPNMYKMISVQETRPIIGYTSPVKETTRTSAKTKKKPIAVKNRQHTLIARIHIAKQQARICDCGRLFFGSKCPDCGREESKAMPDWYYRQILSTLTDRDTCYGMNKTELTKVMDFFNRAGFTSTRPVTSPVAQAEKGRWGTIAQIRKRGKVVLGPEWEGRIDGFVREVVQKDSLNECDMKELRWVIGWINRTAKYQKSSN